MPPHTHRPPPSAITRVCKTSIAFVKKSINLIPFFGVELLLKVVCGQFVHLERLVRLHDGRSAFHVPSHIKEILFVGVGGVLVVGVPGQVVLVREEGAHATQHEDTLAAVHYRQFVLGHQLLSQFLIIEAVGDLAAPVLRLIEAVNGLLAQQLRDLLQGGLLFAAQKQGAVMR